METTEIIKLTKENIGEEHICCAFADKKCMPGYETKKLWLSNQFDHGYTFKKVNVRGKVFIEYGPSEHSWYPIEAENYMMISCFWVSGQFAGHGYGKQLLQECIDDSKDKNGIMVVTSDKKRPFMSDPKFFKKQGFECVDQAAPYFQLWCKKNRQEAPTPQFLDTAKSGGTPIKKGIVVYFSNACPFTDYYNYVHMKHYAITKDVPLELIQFKSREEARQSPVPWIINSVFYNGKFVSQEIKVDKLLDKLIG
jgi:GNAT superfamily N-acetyltransferase